MFIGREDELAALERMYASDRFEMMVLYGRRRVGKTALVDEFVKDKRTLYFTALQQSAAANLRDFSAEVYRFFDMPGVEAPFADWKSAFTFICAQAAERNLGRYVIVFDEFPYAALSNPSLPSVLQICIDHGFKDTRAMIIVSGSNEGFMESQVLGYKSPLYGRRTGQLHLRPFDYYDAARFVPDVSAEEAIQYYAVFGGTPYYLAQIHAGESFENNVARLLFDNSGLLFEEPMMLLRQELREPALYSSILQEIAYGANALNTIADRVRVDVRTVSKYLKTLEGLGLIARTVPVGVNAAKSRKGQYVINDPFFAYWYRFVSRHIGRIESGLGRAVAATHAFGDAFATYVGQQFETICRQWVTRRARFGELPMLVGEVGRWWGTDPRKREQTDIDVVATDDDSGMVLLGECKWRNSFNETEAIELLRQRTGLVQGYSRTVYALFSKYPVHQATRDSNDDVMFVAAADMLPAHS